MCSLSSPAPQPGEPTTAQNRRAAGRFGRARAFTLVELLVSLLLLSLVLSLVYGAFGQISNAALKLRDELTEQQELRLLMRLITDDLRSAQWMERANAKSGGIRTGIVAEPVFTDGKEFTRIDLHVARPARFFRKVHPAADPGVHEVGYSVELSEDRTQRQLVRREDFYVDADLEEGGQKVVLAEGIEAFSIEFLPPNTDPNALTEQWEARWDSPNRGEAARLPVAIRITVGRKDSAGRTWSEQLEFNLPQNLKL